jgi:nucleotide-binding universal stress UspA family protein
MQKIQSILFATDFRSSSDDALNATAKIATAFDSQVSVLHVMEPFLKGDVAGMWEHLTQSLMNPVKRRLDRIAREQYRQRIRRTRCRPTRTRSWR